MAVARIGAFSLALTNHVASFLLWQRGHVAGVPHAGKVGPARGITIEIKLLMYCVSSRYLCLVADLMDPMTAHLSVIVNALMGSIPVIVPGDPCWSSTSPRTCVPQPSSLQRPSTPLLLVPAGGLLCRTGKLTAPTPGKTESQTATTWEGCDHTSVRSMQCVLCNIHLAYGPLVGFPTCGRTHDTHELTHDMMLLGTTIHTTIVLLRVETRHMRGLGNTPALIEVQTTITATTGNPPVMLVLTASVVPVITFAVPLS